MNAHEQEAYELGCEHARNAASWTIDGNTSDEHIRRMVAWFDDGDPRVDDYLPACPNLSGEWAGSPTGYSLYADIVGEDEDDPEGALMDALCDAYEAGVSDTFMAECERILRAAIA